MAGRRATQTIFADDEQRGDGVYGNCLQAAVASLLDLPLDAVPHFSQFVWWDKALELWARGRGLTPISVTVDDPVALEWPDNCIVYGQSPRGISHAVAIIGGEWWDPHPSRSGLTSYQQVVTLESWPNREESA